MEINYDFNQNTPITLNNGIPQAGGTNFEVRIVDYYKLIRFTSNIVGATAVLKLKVDSNPNSVYYTVTVPSNGTGSARLVQVYGYSLRAGATDGLLIFNVYQAG